MYKIKKVNGGLDYALFKAQTSPSGETSFWQQCSPAYMRLGNLKAFIKRNNLPIKIE